MHTAKLVCGSTLLFEAASLLPDVGEEVPCPRHGYCSVLAREGVTRQPRPSRLPPRRSTDELVEFLHRQQATTVGILRRNRFTLRVVAAAEKEGLVDVDIVSGRVVLRGGSRPPRKAAA